MYSPVLARFISADTIVQAPGDPQMLNRYAYTRNNPLKYVDPSGHCFGFALGLDTLGCIGLGIMIAGGLGMAGVVSYQLMPDQIKADAGRAIEALVTDLTRGPASINTTAGSGLQIDPAPALGYPLESVRSAGTSEVYPLAGESGAIQLTTPLGGSQTIGLTSGPLYSKKGREGKQARLRELGDDPKQPSEVRGWIKQDQNEIAQGKRDKIRVPPQYDLAHKRGFEARKGFGYKFAELVTKWIHRLQHKHEGYK